MNFLNKRLLVLGSNTESVPLIERANQLGIISYVADYDPESPGKTVASHPVDIDGKDVKKLAEVCRIEKIDGIIVGVADRLIEPYARLCHLLGYPSYASLENSRTLTNKRLFNELLLKFDINPIKSVIVRKETNLDDLNISFPAIVKPVDGNSGKGLSFCSTERELERAVEKALLVSESGVVMIEKYMSGDDLFVYFSIVDGRVCVSAIADRYTAAMSGNLGRVCIAAKYPSKYLDLFNEIYKKKFENLLHSLGIRVGVFMVSAFVEDGELFFYDPGFRLQGEAPDIHVSSVANVSHLDMLIEYALQGNLSQPDQYFQETPCGAEGCHAATLWILCRAGTIDRVTGIDRIGALSTVHYVQQRLRPGDTIEQNMIGTEGQAFARIYLKVNDLSLINETMMDVLGMLEITDSVGNSMIEDIDYLKVLGCAA